MPDPDPIPDPAADRAADRPADRAGAPAYPPEPWHLRGSGLMTVWRLPPAAVPPLPAGCRPITWRGRAVACTAFVSYDETGLLPYQELLAGVLVSSPVGTGISITDIWVDSEVSRAGGRALWGIPKQMADFERSGPGARLARRGDTVLASALFTPRRAPGLPVPVPLPARTIQTHDAGTVASRLTARGRVRPAHAEWRFPADGELAWLRSARPVLSAIASRFQMRFGPRLTG